MPDDLETATNHSFLIIYNPQVHSYDDVLSEVVDTYLMDIEKISGEEELRRHYDHQVTPDIGIFRVSKTIESEEEFYNFFEREGALLQEVSRGIYYLEKIPHEDMINISPEEFRARFGYLFNRSVEQINLEDYNIVGEGPIGVEDFEVGETESW